MIMSQPAKTALCENDVYGLPSKLLIYSVQLNTTHLTKTVRLYDAEKLIGAACDTGAQQTVIGLALAKAYCSYHHIAMEPFPANAMFVFGDKSSHSLGSMHLIFPSPAGPKIIQAQVFPIPFLLLLGLDILDRQHWNVLTVENSLEIVSEG